ncbi:M81 family metallopeptidase [Sphingosinicella xenopeptidilytica]|uniref:Microcystinase C n=1 Tax=Sphingosinicella xenopeptidilytica TaxID=364098 RepID=A0ABW3C3F3_SPHXN
MKIFAAGIAHESNTFVSEPTTYSDYLVQRGAPGSPMDYPSQDLCQTWGKQAASGGHAFLFSLMAWAQPGGINTCGTYEALRDEMLADLRAALPVDVVLLNLHGAMIAQGYEDCESDIIKHVRSMVGPETVIGVELDLHCHLNETKIAAVDVIVIYKEYPHTDIEARGAELFDLAVATKLGRVKPVMALFDCGMVGLYGTTRQPMRGFVDQMVEAERRTGILSVSLGHGFQFADRPDMGAKMLVVADDDRLLAAQTAREFGSQLYELRHEIGFETTSLSLEEALSRAASNPDLTIVADQSDNPGLGSPGDSTLALRWLLEHRVENAGLAILHDPEVVKIARKAGLGATIQVRLGGKTGRSSGDPLDLEVEVLSMLDDYMHPFPQDNAEPAFYPAGDIVALRCGGVEIVVGSKRCQCFSPSVFTALGIDPTQKSILVPKSTQHFYSAFATISDHILYMAAPGAAPPDPRQLNYKRFDPLQVYPWAQ